MRVRVTLTNDDANEYWIIDDIVVSGTAASASAPTLTTSAATAIAQTTATLGGNISNFGSPSGSSPAYGFVYSLTSANATPQLGGTGTTTVVKGSAAFTGAYTSAVTGLSQNSNYSYQAYATNGTGTTYGGVQTFSTPAPTITTGTVTGAPVCVSSAPASLTVNYTSAGSFTGTYSAELSDASGNFGSPVALTVTASTATSLTVTIPQGTANGSGYKIRVNNTTPATTGSSSAAFTINNLAVSVAPATLTINLGQTNATALTATETPAATSRIWAYGTSASGPFSTTIGGQTGTSYTPQPANFGNVLGTYYVVAVSTLGTCTVTSAPVAVTVDPATGPYVSVNPSTLALGSVALNTPGTIQTYQVSGVNLGTTGITITPPVGVEVSTNGFVTSANTNASPLTLPASGGSVANTTISVRLAASASSTNVSSNITNVSSTGSASVAVSGSVAPPASACLSENFNSFTGSSGFTSGNTGWTATGLGNYTSAGSSGAAANAAKFDDSGDVLITPTLSGTASSLSFFVLGNGTDASSSLLVEGFNGTAYSTIATLSNLPTAGATITYNATSTPALTAGTYTRFRFTYTKSVGNLSFDDLVVSCGGAPAFTLSTGTITGSPFCINQGTGTSISVPFTVSGGSFGTANVFTAQLSDASGSFATPTNLGTLTAVTSGTITGSIPASVSTTGTGYRVRVVGSTPATNGTDNGTDLSVTNYQSNEIPSATATALPGNGQVTVSFGAPASCATSVIITARAGSAGSLKPLAGNTYTANTTFGAGTNLGSGQYVVYNGPLSSSVTVTGLTNGTQYFFQLFTTGGSGYSDGIVRSARPVLPATLTEVVVPQLISARTTASTHTTRLPYVWRATISGLTASTTYKYYTAVRAAADVPGYGGAGIPVETKVAGAFVRGTSPALTNASSTFTTDASGSYTGWFAVEPSADARFADGSQLYPMVVLDAGDGANVATHFLATTSAVTARLLGTAASQATGVRGSSFGTPSNFVLTYDNTAGTGRPLAGTWIESDGWATTSYASFYSSVDGTAGAYGLLTPNTNTSGIRRLEQRSLADGSLVGCAATDADGSWTGGANTVSPNGGTTALVLTTGDTPFASPTVLENFSPATAAAGSTITINGTNFTTGPRPTVSFNGGTPVTATGTSSTSLTVVVPVGATSGPLTVSTGCGSATTTGSFSVAPSGFYTKPTGDVGLLATYGDQPDGSGTAPTSFTLANQTFTITATTANRTFASNWSVTGTGSKVVLATGASLVVPATATLTARVDMSSNATLQVLNSTVSGITYGTLASNSTIDYAQTSGTFNVPGTVSYVNLKLTNGNKRLDNTTVSGNLTFDNTVISGAVLNTSTTTAGDYPIVQLAGNFSQLSGVSYDRTRNITLQLTNTSAAQTLAGNGNTIELYRLYTATGSGAVGGILTGTGSVLMLANSIDGGLALYDATASLELGAGTTMRFLPNGGGNIFVGTNGLLKPSPTSNLEFYRNTVNTYTLGTLRLAPGFTTINNLILNSTASGANTLTLTSDLTVNGTATLQAGTLVIDANTLTLNGSLSVATGGFLNGSTSSNLTIGGSGSFGTLSFASGARLLNNLTMNRAGGTLTLGAPLTVSGTLALSNGIISTSSSSLLTLTNAASITGGSVGSHINGPLARTANSGARNLFLPVGKAGNYRPLTLATLAQGNTVTYTAEQFEGAPSAGTFASGSNLTRVSARRYFTITPSTAPTSYSGRLTITFDVDDFVNYPADPTFVMAKRSDASSPWTNIGHFAETGTSNNSLPVAGTLTSDLFTSFSDFALASTSTTGGFPSLNPLPVELTSFTGARQTNGVALRWATASEKNSAYFDVERSLDGKVFAAIGRVEGHGSSARGFAYSQLDAQAPQQLLYYRLRQVDTDGTASLSPVVVIAAGSAAELTVFPNPAKSSLQFLSAAAAPYRVLNQLGQIVLKGTAEAGTTTVAVDALPAGVYHLELQTSQGRVVRKFVKE